MRSQALVASGMVAAYHAVRFSVNYPGCVIQMPLWTASVALLDLLEFAD